MDARCCTQHTIFPLTDQERGACDAALHLSQHTKIELLPNVHINEKMELSGFHFESDGCDMANVLPIPTNLFDCIVAYEVLNEVNSNFNDRVLHILQNMDEYKTKLAALFTELKANTTNPSSMGRPATQQGGIVPRVRAPAYEGYYRTQAFNCGNRITTISRRGILQTLARLQHVHDM